MKKSIIAQKEITTRSKLLDAKGNLAQVGWSRQPMLDCNLEDTHIEKTAAFWQPMRIKVWDYYGFTTPTHFISFTVSNVGYIASIFAYVIDFKTGKYTEQTLTVPLAKGAHLPRNSDEGETCFDNGKVHLHFSVKKEFRTVSARWKDFLPGKPLNAEIEMKLPSRHESMNIVIPIKGRRFYFNRKINCIPASGWVEYAGKIIPLDSKTALGNLDWGRGVWEYKSFWVWASASGFLPGRHTIGLNLGFGFGDTSAATENCFILDGCVHKLGEVEFVYNNLNFKKPWTMKSPDGRLDLTFTPFVERVAKTDLKILASEVHQMFGHYNGTVITDEGKKVVITDLVGWAEEHQAKW